MIENGARLGSGPGLSLQTVVIRIVVAAALILAVWALAQVLLVVFFAVLLACILRGLTDFGAVHTGIRPSLVLAALVLLTFLAVGGGVWWIGPKLLVEWHDLVHRLMDAWHDLAPRLGMPTSPGASLSRLRGHLASPATAALGSSLDIIAGLVVIIVTAIYLAASPELYVRGVLHLFPAHRRKQIGDALQQTGKTLQRWALGQLVDMIIVGVLAGGGLWLLGVPVPFALGVLAGLLTFIPYFGAILAAVPAILLAFTVSGTTALWALGIYTLCHCIEGYLIGPIVQRRLVDLPPALTVVSMTVSGALFGVLGIVLGTPLAAVGLTLVRKLYVEDTLDDGTVGGGNIMQPDNRS